MLVGLPSLSGDRPGVGNEGAAEFFLLGGGRPTPGPAAPSLAPPLMGRGNDDGGDGWA